jgi:hypothetical protein
MYPANNSPLGRPRKDLEAMLFPLVRRAVRDRTGPTALVVWVQRNLAALGERSQPDSERAAGGLTCLLCDLLLQRTRPVDSRRGETLCGL